MKNQDLLQLVEEYGSPLYVYNAEKIESQYKRLTNAFSKVEQFKIHYAVKALSNLSILKVITICFIMTVFTTYNTFFRC